MRILNLIFLQCFVAEIQSPLFQIITFFLPVTKLLKCNIVHSCVYECLMNIYTTYKLYLLTILITGVYALNRNNHAKLYLPSKFHTSDMELLSPKIETQKTSH